jgi:hypothetical protein
MSFGIFMEGGEVVVFVGAYENNLFAFNVLSSGFGGLGEACCL